MDDASGTDGEPREQILEYEVEPAEDHANYLVLEAVADAESVDVVDLPPMYERIDHVLDELFGEPPAPEAQVEIAFSYHGYRITIDQSGSVRLKKLDTDAAAID